MSQELEDEMRSLLETYFSNVDWTINGDDKLVIAKGSLLGHDLEVATHVNGVSDCKIYRQAATRRGNLVFIPLKPNQHLHKIVVDMKRFMEAIASEV